MNKHSVAIVDDHQLVRAGLRSLIEDFGDYEVVAEAEDAMGAIGLADDHKPEVMVLDITMPGTSGLDVLPTVKSVSPHTHVLVMSMYDSHDFVMKALRQGANGYLLKDFAAVELQLALKSLVSGRRFLSPSVSSGVVEQALSSEGQAGSRDDKLASLTPRQTEILKLIASGQSAKEVAHGLGLSVKTVETHRAQIMERLGIRDVPRLVLFAVRHGLVSASEDNDGPVVAAGHGEAL